MILYLTHPAQLHTVDCSRTISLPASLLSDRSPFMGASEMVKRIRQKRLASETTVAFRRVVQ